MRSRLGVILAVYCVHLALALLSPGHWRDSSPTLHSTTRAVIWFFSSQARRTCSNRFRLGRASLTSVAEGSVFAVLAVSYLGLLPLAALIYALAHTGKATFATLVAAAGRFFGTFSLLLGLSLIAMALLGFVPLTIGNLLDDKLKNALGDRGHDLVRASFRVIALLLVAIVVVVHDLARAATVSRELPALRAVLAATDVFRLAPWRAAGAWAIRGAAAVLLVLVAAWVTSRLGVETGPRFAMVTLLHQGVVFALLLLRASWLRSAVVLVTR